MIEMGVVIGIGLLVTLVKMNWKWRMHMLSNPLFVDALIFIALLLIHWGTFSGAMVASVGAMTCSLTLAGARALFGYVEQGKYKAGYFDVRKEL